MSRPHVDLHAARSFIVESTKVSLSVLESVSSFIPLPYVQTAVSAAIQVIQLAETVASNRSDCDALINRVYAVILVATEPFLIKGSDVDLKLKRNIEQLNSDLSAIKDVLESIQKTVKSRRIPKFFKSVAMSGDIAGKIKSCSGKLDWAMTVFQVKSDININMILAEVQATVKEMASAVQRIEAVKRSPSVPLPSVLIPPKSAIFYGRNADVATITDRLDSADACNVAILGSGGLGKTSVALAVLEERRIMARFGKGRYWSPCMEATSVTLLVELIAKTFKIKPSGNDRLEDIVSTLRSSPEPRLLVLDNFETPWDIEGRQGEVEHVLTSVAAIPSLSLILTTRGNRPPSTRIRWTAIPLQVLSLEASRQTYVDIHPEAENDPSLDTLLGELDHMPLAVTLMAEVGANGVTPTELLERWREERTDVLDLGQERTNSVNVSIRLSLKSTVVRWNPDTILLLSILSMLPGGARKDFIRTIAPTITRPDAALMPLLRTSLASSTPDGSSIHVLSPIRSHMLQYHPPSDKMENDLFHAYYHLVTDYNFKCLDLGSTPYTKAASAVSRDEANAQSILLLALKKDESASALEAALSYGWYLYYARPQTEVVIAALETARRTSSPLEADLTRCLGNIYEKRCEYDEAVATLEAAREAFRVLKNTLEVCRCQQTLGIIHLFQDRYDEARSVLQEAREGFLSVGELLGAARCLQGIGDNLWENDHYEEARPILEEARREFQNLKDHVGEMQCSRSLGYILLAQCRYDEARSALEMAREGFVRIGDHRGAGFCTLRLGEILIEQRRYDDATVVLQNAQDTLKRLNSPWGRMRCILDMGQILVGRGRFDDARSTLLEARDGFVRLATPREIAECDHCLGDLSRLEHRYTEARSALQDARKTFEQIGSTKRVLDCLRSLAVLSREQDQYDEAIEGFQAAATGYQQLGLPVKEAACLEEIEGVRVLQSRTANK